MIERTTRFIICLCPECRHTEGRGEYNFINNDEEREHHFTASGELIIFYEIRFHIYDWVCGHEDRHRCILVRDYIPNDRGELRVIQRQDLYD